LRFEIAGVLEGSKLPLLGVQVSSSHLPQSGVATITKNTMGRKGYGEP